MLSGAQHLQYLLENKQMQILRSAQDDSPGTLCAACLGRNAARQTRSYRSIVGEPTGSRPRAVKRWPVRFGEPPKGEKTILKNLKISLAFGFYEEYDQ
jgi:hypothetical protein